jgi:dolichyl-phosphate beta-glucosyltransferase
VLTVVIPTYNEERRIPRTIQAIQNYMAREGWPFDILVSDDGSTDGTAQVVLRMAQEGVPVRFLRASRHRGKGWAVRRGVMEARGDLVLISDADLATPISEVTKLLAAIDAGADIAIGSCGLAQSCLVVRQPLYREYSGRLFNWFVRILVLPGVRDTQCGFKLMRRTVAHAVFGQCTVDGFAGDVEALVLAVRSGFAVAEVPVKWAHDADTKVSLVRHSAGMLLDLVRIAVRGWFRLDARVNVDVSAGGCDE